MKNLLQAVCLLVVLSSSAFAGLSFVGPLDPAHGFPRWYKDLNNTRLQLCLDINTFCLPLNVDPTLSISFPDNFPDEAFWWNGEGLVNIGTGQIRLVMAIEAAFAGAVPVAGERISFARLRIRARGIPTGNYRITHPYGQHNFTVTSTTGRQINMTNDVGIEVEVFSGALKGDIGPFLIWDPAVLPLAPGGFIGDPAILHTVKGSPFGTNFMRVERWNGTSWIVQGFTNQFRVAGKYDTLPEEPIVSVSPRGGIFQIAPIVSIQSSIDSKIYYTLDGTNPLSSPTRQIYTEPIQLNGCAALKYAAETLNAISDIGTELYVTP